MNHQRSKLDQACNLLIRQRLRTRSMENTVRELAMLLSENSSLIDERNEMALHPLGFVHGTLGRLREMIGPEVKIRLDLSADALAFRVFTPDGDQIFSFSDTDYDMNVDMLAASIRSICEQRGLLAKAKG